MIANGLGSLVRVGVRALIAVALTAIAVAQPAGSAPTLVKIDSGSVHGVVAGDVVAFKGIPFAQPPVGALRWRPPQPVRPWDGVREADALRPDPMQPPGKMPLKVGMSEDCLYLNVWRPATAADHALPVMVWIYGGGLVRGGTSLYPGDALARQGIVVVTFNYRLGRLGFFAHPALAREAPDDLRGNYGYMDQIAALQWVRRNIAAFGGDPQNVTIAGESAGGGSVLVHLTSPLSSGLFQRAIPESPGIPTARRGAAPLRTLAAAESIAVEYAQGLGIQRDDGNALSALRAVPAENLVSGTDDYVTSILGGPEIPGLSHSIIDGRLVVDAPEAILRSARQALVPVIVGANDADLAWSPAQTKDGLFAAFGSRTPEARARYDPHGDKTLPDLVQAVVADQVMVEPARHLADLMSQAGCPVYLYRFSYVAEGQRASTPGAAHAAEIVYAFDLVRALLRDKATDADVQMGHVLSGYWVNFVKTGDPNGGERPKWPRYEPNAREVFNFTNDGVTFERDPLKERLDLWRDVWESGSHSPGAEHVATPPGTPESLAPASPAIPVTVQNFARAESDLYFGRTVQDGGLGKLRHRRELANIDAQDVVRMNRDTLYSSGVFDLKAAPVTIVLPEAGKRFMSMQVVSQDHYAIDVAYAPGRHTYTNDNVGTRYAFIVVRTLANPRDAADMQAAHGLQDAIEIEQASRDNWEAPPWDPISQKKVRDALNVLGSTRGDSAGEMFGSQRQIDPLLHLIGTATGWGGNPRSAAVYLSVYPDQNDGTRAYTLTVKDVPVDGFWSVSVYNAEGYFEKNDLGAYTLNSLTATPNADGSFTIRFGGPHDAPNYLPIMPAWNYTVRLYRPRSEIINGSWAFPRAVPAP